MKNNQNDKKLQNSLHKKEKKKKKGQELIVNLKYDDEIPSYFKYFSKKQSE